MSADSPGQSVALLHEVVRVLNERSIEYAVIGAMAVSVHGVVRASLDADAVVSVVFSELKALANELLDRLLKRFGKNAVANYERIVCE